MFVHMRRIRGGVEVGGIGIRTEKIFKSYHKNIIQYRLTNVNMQKKLKVQNANNYALN